MCYRKSLFTGESAMEHAEIDVNGMFIYHILYNTHFYSI